MKAPILSVKINYRGDIKRRNLPETFEDLKEIIVGCFALTQGQLETFSVTYLDDEGDAVLISNEFDYSQAILFMKRELIDVLKLIVEPFAPDGKPTENMFELINGPEGDSRNCTISTIKDNKEKDKLNCQQVEDILVENLNGIMLSDDLNDLKQNFRPEKLFYESNDEDCKNILTGIIEKSKAEVEQSLNSEAVPITKKESFLSQLTKRILNNLGKFSHDMKTSLQEKHKTATDFVDKIFKKQNQEMTVEQAKKMVRKSVKKILTRHMKSLRKKILSEVCEKTDLLVYDMFAQNRSQHVQTSQTSTGCVVHNNVCCNNCKVYPIVGIRYNCSVCEDFDLCEKCEQYCHHEQHPMVKIRNPEKSLKVKAELAGLETQNKVNEQANFYCNKVIDATNKLSREIVNAEEVRKNSNLPFEFKDIFELFGVRDKNERGFNSKFNTEELKIKTVNNNHEVRKFLSAENCGTATWPKPCYLTCVKEESNVFGISIPLRIRISPGNSANFIVCLDLKGVKMSGNYKSTWQLQDEKKEFFGEKVVIQIEAEFKDEISIKPEFLQVPKELFKKSVLTTDDILKKNGKDVKNLKGCFHFSNLVDKMKSTYDVQGIEDTKIMYALIKTGGDLDTAFDNLKLNRSIYNKR